MRGKVLQPYVAAVPAHDVPDKIFTNAVAPNCTILADGTEHSSAVYLGRGGPAVQLLFGPNVESEWFEHGRPYRSSQQWPNVLDGFPFMLASGLPKTDAIPRAGDAFLGHFSSHSNQHRPAPL